jgi:hypothetical protein
MPILRAGLRYTEQKKYATIADLAAALPIQCEGIDGRRFALVIGG